MPKFSGVDGYIVTYFYFLDLTNLPSNHTYSPLVEDPSASTASAVAHKSVAQPISVHRKVKDLQRHTGRRSSRRTSAMLWGRVDCQWLLPPWAHGRSHKTIYKTGWWFVVSGMSLLVLFRRTPTSSQKSWDIKRRKQIKRMRAGFQCFGLWTAQFFKSLGCQQVDIPAPMWSWARFVKWKL